MPIRHCQGRLEGHHAWTLFDIHAVFWVIQGDELMADGDAQSPESDHVTTMKADGNMLLQTIAIEEHAIRRPCVCKGERPAPEYELSVTRRNERRRIADGVVSSTPDGQLHLLRESDDARGLVSLQGGTAKEHPLAILPFH